jgi:hypothetical protein
MAEISGTTRSREAKQAAVSHATMKQLAVHNLRGLGRDSKKGLTWPDLTGVAG